MLNSSVRNIISFVLTSSLLAAPVLRAADKKVSSSPSRALPLVVNGKPSASIVIGKAESASPPFAATELQRYLRTLSGAEVRIIEENQISSRPSSETLILVGGPAQNDAVRELAAANEIDFNSLKADGFVLKQVVVRKHPALVVAGNDEVSTMYGVYELIERLGVTFLLTGDIVPPVQPNLSAPMLDLRMEPSFARRGFLLQDGGYENLTMFSYKDYVKLLDQMAKMKCNYVQFWWFSFEPWIKYSYHGETMWMGDVSKKESGYLTWTYNGFGSRTTDDVSIGKQWFKGRRMAPPEMQNVETPDQAFDVAETMLHRIIRYAKSRGIKVWLAIEPATLPPNLARFCDPINEPALGNRPFNQIFGTFVHPLDPVNREIQVNRLKALIQTYPEAEGYFLVFPELYPQLDTDKYHSFFERMQPAFADLKRLHEPWSHSLYHEGDRYIDTTIGYENLFEFLLKKRDEIAPTAKLGVMGIGRGYMLPLIDKMLPKDIPFTDMESSSSYEGMSIWTSDEAGVPMNYFGGMGDRERTIEPRMDDDDKMMGMQFNVRRYEEKDRIFKDGVKYGLTGFAGQLNRARGTETNTRFMAEAAWQPQLTTEEFYKNYSERLFGTNAAPEMYRAFMALEENDTKGLSSGVLDCCGPLAEVDAAYNYSHQADPYDGPTEPAWKGFIMGRPNVVRRLQGSVKLLDQALESMQAALPKVAPQGLYQLRYMVNRTEAYREFEESLITINQAYLKFNAAFANKNEETREQFLANLDESLAQFDQANQQVQAATQKYAEIMDNPSDLGVLYHMNARAVLGFDLARRWIQNIVDYQEGKPYVAHVPFERLFFTDIRIQGSPW